LHIGPMRYSDPDSAQVSESRSIFPNFHVD
jgi:hypothetical protein